MENGKTLQKWRTPSSFFSAADTFLMMKGEVPTFEPHDLQENVEASLSILCPSKKTGMGEKRGVAQPSDQFLKL